LIVASIARGATAADATRHEPCELVRGPLAQAQTSGRRRPVLRGAITGGGTFLGGGLHTLPFLIPDVHTALLVAAIVVALELTTISLIRKRFLAVSLRVSLLQVALGGAMIVAVGVALGNA
jgi:hypothetical protein